MKKIILSFTLLGCLQIAAKAQAPAGFNYQGIARNASGAPLASRPLGLRISIHDGSAVGPVVYQETQQATTNSYGLYNLTIGSGNAVAGTLGSVDWAAGSRFLQIELDAAGGTAYTDLGTSQLMSVPYALHAGSAPAPAVSFSNDTLSVGNSRLKLPAPVLAGDVTGGAGANTVTRLQSYPVSTKVPTGNEVLKYNGAAWTPAQDVDTQKLSISGNTLSLSNGGSVSLPAAPVYTGGTGITVAGTSISASNLTGDVTGAPNATIVTRIQGTGVAATAPASGQVLKYNGTAWAPATDTGLQGSGTANYLPKLTGPSAIANSQIFDNGTRIAVGNAAPNSSTQVDINFGSSVTPPSILRVVRGAGIGFTISSPGAAILAETGIAGSNGINAVSRYTHGVYGESILGTTGIGPSMGAGVFGYNDNSGPGIWGVSSSGPAGYFDGGRASSSTPVIPDSVPYPLIQQ